MPGLFSPWALFNLPPKSRRSFDRQLSILHFFDTAFEIWAATPVFPGTFHPDGVRSGPPWFFTDRLLFCSALFLPQESAPPLPVLMSRPFGFFTGSDDTICCGSNASFF